MNLNKFLNFDGLNDLGPDFEFEAQVLERNKQETDLLNKKGYRIKKSVWNGLIAS